MPRLKRRAAFTLIEVLVVVAIIALLVAILLPSLANARELSRRTVCATQLKQFSNSTTMYTGESRDFLPGPIHPALELETFQKSAARDYEQWHLLYLTRRYFTDRSVGGKSTDEVSKCPTAFQISARNLKNAFVRSDYRRPFSYALNNWDAPNVSLRYGTNPERYFGWPDDFWVDTPAPFQMRSGALPDKCKPKKINVVRQPGREWALADAFRYTNEIAARNAADPKRKPGQWVIGTYQSEFVRTYNLIPDQPYHSRGINVGMFDGHVEYQRPWRGTVNPK